MGQMMNTFSKILNKPSSYSNFSLFEAIVTQTEDPECKNRVKVNIVSSYGEKGESYWASVLMPYAGDQHGMTYVPEVGDIVIVGFLSGDITTPIVLGSVYGYVVNSDNTVLEQIPPNQGNTKQKIICSKSGHKIIFDDTEDEECITIIDKSGNKININADSIVVDCQSKAKIEVLSDGNINITTEQDCNINASNVSITGNGDVSIGNNVLPQTGFCALPQCVFSGVSHTTNKHPMS
jgi:uncharacterized protein involved in type VI secretion and phage assembly